MPCVLPPLCASCTTLPCTHPDTPEALCATHGCPAAPSPLPRWQELDEEDLDDDDDDDDDGLMEDEEERDEEEEGGGEEEGG